MSVENDHKKDFLIGEHVFGAKKKKEEDKFGYKVLIWTNLILSTLSTNDT